MSSKNTLQIPPIAVRDKGSFEILRVWVAKEAQHVSLLSGTWDDPYAWGIFLADLALHIINAESQGHGDLNVEQFKRRMVEGFHEELDEPTGDPQGNLV